MAGRQPYKITKQDYGYAARYLIKAMERGDISKTEGYNAFKHARNADLLQKWCDDYLPSEVFGKMKSAIRASRKRSRDYRTSNRKVGIDLDHLAHVHLSSLADDLSLSLSDTVLHLENVYWIAKKAGVI